MKPTKEPEKWAELEEIQDCPDCGSDPEGPCSEHRFYQCPSCLRWYPWSHGCADDMPELCDACWCDFHKSLWARLLGALKRLIGYPF